MFNITKYPPNSCTALNPCPPLGSTIQSNSVPDKLVAPAATISATLIYPKVYPEPAFVTVTDVTAPPETTQVTTPPVPSPLIAILVCVPLVPLAPAVLIFTTFIAPAVAAELTVESVATAIKSVDKKFAA